MGQRRLLGRVFFQGKPATDPALARTLAAVLEREVVVPADPGAMGAVGIALLARRGARGRRRAPARHRPRARARRQGRRAARVPVRRPRLPQQLPPRAREIDVGGAVEKIVSGGQCPKYDAVSAAGEKLPKDAPNPYRERDDLLRALLDDEEVRADGTPAATPAQPAVRGAHRPAVRALPDRHAAVLPHAAAAPGPPGRGAPAGPRHAGRRRPPLRRPGRLRAGQAAARAGRRRRRRLLRADLRAPAAAQRRRADVHLPHGAGRAGHGRARAARGGLARRACSARRSSREKATGSTRRACARSVSLADARAGRQLRRAPR